MGRWPGMAAVVLRETHKVRASAVRVSRQAWCLVTGWQVSRSSCNAGSSVGRFQEFSPAHRKRMERTMDDVYRAFVSHVANSRNIPYEKVGGAAA